MAKIRRGGSIFRAYKGDHSPTHVHVYKDRRLIVKWDLEHGRAMKGEASSTLIRLINDLKAEGRL